MQTVRKKHRAYFTCGKEEINEKQEERLGILAGQFWNEPFRYPGETIAAGKLRRKMPMRKQRCTGHLQAA